VRLNKVALLATDGMTNRQIAGRVFLSPKSVDGVMARVYEKLGVHTRAETWRQPGRAGAGLA